MPYEILAAEIPKRINALLARFMKPDALPSVESLVGAPSGHRASLVSCVDAINRYSPPGSGYTERAKSVMVFGSTDESKLADLAALLQGLRDDYEQGLLTGVLDLSREAVFDDFLEMAAELLNEGYKDAAAVIAGTVLEDHLRKLAPKHNVEVTKANGEPEKANVINGRLISEGAYDGTRGQEVTTWLSRRNDAAHGHYGRYGPEDVSLMIAGIRGFVTRFSV